MYFSNYGLRKTWLEQYLKGAISEDPLTIDRKNGAKHC